MGIDRFGAHSGPMGQVRNEHTNPPYRVRYRNPRTTPAVRSTRKKNASSHDCRPLLEHSGQKYGAYLNAFRRH